jgi:type I restriction enzyme S subunit
MSKLERLIAEHCPKGVEFKPLGEIGMFYGGLTGKSKEDFYDGNAKYISYMNVFSHIAVNTNIKDFVKIAPNERQYSVAVGDIIFTGSSETREECGMSSVLTRDIGEPLYLNSFCFGFRLNDNNLLLPEFSKHLFRSHELRKQIVRTASGVTRFNVSKEKMKQVVTPLPPVDVQRKIVRILDNFTESTVGLITKLAEELETRKTQYEYYRKSILRNNAIIQYIALGEICNLCAGGDVPKGRISKEKTNKYNVPIYSNGIGVNALYGWTDEAKITNPCVTIAARGTIGYAALREEPFVPVVRLICAIPNENILAKYLKYTIDILTFQIPTSGIPQLTVPMVSKYKIPVLPLDEQKYIVGILDRFNVLENGITTDLSAEIEGRRKQYEYYRDRLLSF